MDGILQTLSESTTVQAITGILFITGSITTFDVRLIQWQRANPDIRIKQLPSWTGLLIWAHYGLLLWLFFIDWKYALALWVTLFVLAVLPVLETVGNVLMAPFGWRVSRPSHPDQGE